VLFEEFGGYRRVGEGSRGGLKRPDDKKLQINFAGVGKVSTFAVPNKTGAKKAEGAMP